MLAGCTTRRTGPENYQGWGTIPDYEEQRAALPAEYPVEICDENYRYYGKVAVRKLILETGKTSLEVEVLKLFDKGEADVYTSNFIRL